MKVIAMLITCFFLSGCGYMLYPERVGSINGKIDPVVVILDGAGLLVGILPGVVAFAVDFSTGAIYMPQNQETIFEKHQKRNQPFTSLIKNELIEISPEVEAGILEITGLNNLENIEYYQLNKENMALLKKPFK